MNAQTVVALASSTEARYRARTSEREQKWRGFRKGDLSSVETPKRIALRAARLGVWGVVELLVVDAMGSFDLAVRAWGPRPNVDVPDVVFLETPVECDWNSAPLSV
jgi:hypothetical protein